MFSLAKKYRSRIKRLYIYNWRRPCRPTTRRFDAGLLNADGEARPGYKTVKRYLGSRTLQSVAP